MPKPAPCRTPGTLCASCKQEIPLGSFMTFGKTGRYHIECTRRWYAEKARGIPEIPKQLPGIIETESRIVHEGIQKPLIADSETGGAALLNALQVMIQSVANASVDEAKVREIVADAVSKLAKNEPREIRVKFAEKESIDVGIAHETFPKLLKIVSAKKWAWVVGPAGSGKTYACEQIAKALSLPFFFDGRTDTDYKLLGFIHPTLGAIETPFRKAFTQGGVYLADELDAWEAQASLALQAALANGSCTFPGSPEPLPRHENFVFIAAANTFGYGADSQYVGRNKLDAAFLDRFVFLPWAYDEKLERAVAGDTATTGKIQSMRAIAVSKGLKVVISPRASIACASLMQAGFSESEAIEMAVLNKLSKSDRQILTGRA